MINISFSQYFVQFSQLWPLITEIVETYANGMDVDEFCPIFVNALNKITRGRHFTILLNYNKFRLTFSKILFQAVKK